MAKKKACVVQKRNGRYRLVDPSTGNLSRNRHGTVRDGGGHTSFTKAVVQATAVNTAKRKKT